MTAKQKHDPTCSPSAPFPCPYPGCANGIDAEMLVVPVPHTMDRKTYRRKQHPVGGGWSWDDIEIANIRDSIAADAAARAVKP